MPFFSVFRFCHWFVFMLKSLELLNTLLLSELNIQSANTRFQRAIFSLNITKDKRIPLALPSVRILATPLTKS